MKQEKDKKPNSRLKNWAIFTGIGFQMGATIFICAWIGRKLDARYPSDKNWFTIGFVFFGMIAAIYAVVKQLKHFNDN